MHCTQIWNLLLKLKLKGKSPFHYLCINHVNDKLSFTCYCKATDTGLIMNYHALAPKCYKRSVVKGFVHRVYRAYSSWVNFHDSVEKVQMILQWNKYPQDFYDPIISKTTEKLESPKVNQKDQEVDFTSQKVT